MNIVRLLDNADNTRRKKRGVVHLRNWIAGKGELGDELGVENHKTVFDGHSTNFQKTVQKVFDRNASQIVIQLVQNIALGRNNLTVSKLQ